MSIPHPPKRRKGEEIYATDPISALFFFFYRLCKSLKQQQAYLRYVDSKL